MNPSVPNPVSSQDPKTKDKPAIVLVHGAWADGSGWAPVIVELVKNGFHVVAVQNPLTSLADDVANTRRVLEAQTGPVVVVGHSYGGAVITAAAKGVPNVKALVYVAAFAPEAGDQIMPLLEKYPSLIGTSLVPDSAGFLYIARDKFKESFCADVSDRERVVMVAAQKPIHSSIFGAKFDAPAWKDVPSWYLVAKSDNAINPELQRMFAKRMKATVEEVDSSHVPYVSKPDVVVDLIEAAVQSVVVQVR